MLSKEVRLRAIGSDHLAAAMKTSQSNPHSENFSYQSMGFKLQQGSA